jgi:two-component system cell cycle sensor histidine kinase/response regulator CckA
MRVRAIRFYQLALWLPLAPPACLGLIHNALPPESSSVGTVLALIEGSGYTGGIFEPFFTTKSPEKGTGLGLATAYGIIKQSRGFIWVYSKPGIGTTFKIYLPQVAERVVAPRRDSSAESGRGTETILLVEDNAGLRKLALRLLEPVGYTVLPAASAEEALPLLEQHQDQVHLLVSPVDLLLTDVVMPGMSGQKLAERLALTHPKMRVLYMSGYTDDTTMRHGVLQAQMAFLSKPFTRESLLRNVREVLDA